MGRLQQSRLLSWEDLMILRHHGCRVGSHTHRHLELDLLPREQVRSEIHDAQRALRQRLGADEPVISYPRGRSSPAVEEEVRAAGYRWGLGTTPGRITSAKPTLSARRVMVAPDDGARRLVWKASRLRLWGRRFKQSLGRPPIASSSEH
jgi:peptidoglycan/xylan/chitin deacetylase (PgdA/CDA1 family)